MATMTRLKVCNQPGCPTFSDQPRCPAHRRAHEQARGTRQQRGYDANHDRERRYWEPIVAAGGVNCWRCGNPIDPTQPWDCGHDDNDRSIHRGPEHPACNRATAGRGGG